MANVNEIDIATKRYIVMSPKVVDNVFKGGRLFSLLRDTIDSSYTGGRLIQAQTQVRPSTGGGFAVGDTFATVQQKLIEDLQVTIRFMETDTIMDKAQAEVINTGDNAIVKLIQVAIDSGAATMGEMYGLAIYFGALGNYTKNVTGLAEALGASGTASWDGTTYTNYATQSRVTYPALDAYVENVGGPISRNVLGNSYSRIAIGNSEPTHGFTTPLVWDAIEARFQNQQGFQETQDPKIGFTGLRYRNAIIHRDWACPGALVSGTLNPTAVNWLTTTTGGNVVSYPAQTTESFFWLTLKKEVMQLFVSSAKDFAFNHTGWKTAQNNLSLIGQFLAALNFICLQPRLNAQLYGITV